MTGVNGEQPMWGLREPVCTATHVMALIWAVYAVGILWRTCRGDPTKRRAIAFYGASMILLFAASSLYHAVIAPAEVIALLRRIDMSMVYVYIVGTCVPVLAILPAGRFRSRVTAAMCSLAAAGIAVRWLVPGNGLEINVALYLLLGWLCLGPLFAVARQVGSRGISLALGGGLLYTFGAVCDVLRWPVLVPGYLESHQLMHMLGFVGSMMHFAFVAQYIVPLRPGPGSEADSPDLAPDTI